MALTELEDLLDEARRAGTVQSSGQFTLDFKAAIAKLRGFQVENQYHYINRLIRTAALAEAHHIDIKASASKTRVSFSQAACQPHQLEQLFEQIFQNTRPAARELATATNISLALQPSQLEIQICDGEVARVLKIEGQKVGAEFKTVGEIYETAPVNPGTNFQLTRSFGASVVNWGIQSPEYLEVLRRFRYSPMTMTINGEKLDRTSWWGSVPRASYTSTFSADELVKLRPHFLSLARYYKSRHHVIELRVYHSTAALNCIGLGPSLAGTLLTRGAAPPPLVPGGADRCFLALGLCVDSKRPSVANFIYSGETLQSFPAKLALPGVELLICAQDLNLDLSGEKLTQDELFQERWRVAKSFVDELYQALLNTYSVNPKDFARRVLFDAKCSWKSFLPSEESHSE